MEKREKFEVPTIEFTPVTLLAGKGSTTCGCDNYSCSRHKQTDGFVEKDCDNYFNLWRRIFVSKEAWDKNVMRTVFLSWNERREYIDFLDVSETDYMHKQYNNLFNYRKCKSSLWIDDITHVESAKIC